MLSQRWFFFFEQSFHIKMHEKEKIQALASYQSPAQ